VIKGYIFKNEETRWELGFVSDIGEDGQALYTTYNDYPKWEGALTALIKYQQRAA